MTILRSPVVVGAQFRLPFDDVVRPAAFDDTFSQLETSAPVETDPHQEAQSLKQLLAPPKERVAVLGRFIELGIPRDRPGLRHTVVFIRRPASDSLFTLSEATFKVSGYLSYNYLMCGSTTVGMVFSTDNVRTSCTHFRLVVKASPSPANWSPNFNLEKMGLFLFVADDSSVMVTAGEVESSLVVRSD